MITVTNNAVKHLHYLLSQQSSSIAHKGLRLMVSKGGCAGMKYHLKLDSPSADDTIVRQKNTEIYIDPTSKHYLDGCIVDYAEQLNETGFNIRNPNASRNCDCGSSFEPKDNPPSV